MTPTGTGLKDGITYMMWEVADAYPKGRSRFGEEDAVDVIDLGLRYFSEKYEKEPEHICMPEKFAKILIARLPTTRENDFDTEEGTFLGIPVDIFYNALTSMIYIG